MKKFLTLKNMIMILAIIYIIVGFSFIFSSTERFERNDYISGSRNYSDEIEGIGYMIGGITLIVTGSFLMLRLQDKQ